MEVPENLERGRRFWVEWCGGPPTDAEKLNIEFVTVTSTLVERNVMNAI
jgi:hypothetical protein